MVDEEEIDKGEDDKVYDGKGTSVVKKKMVITFFFVIPRQPSVRKFYSLQYKPRLLRSFFPPIRLFLSLFHTFFKNGFESNSFYGI